MRRVLLQVNGPDDMIALGERIGKEFKPNMVVTLLGDLGAGKTTITKGFAKGMDIKGIINSPTFTIMKIHNGKMPLFHMDVYRLDNSTGDDYLEEYFYMDGVSVIEWADNLSDIIPDEKLQITITNISDVARKLEIKAIGQEYEDLLERVFANE
jgi:tRNA threonylcarbamoyladenosine biosynthesis protein TsaE